MKTGSRASAEKTASTPSGLDRSEASSKTPTRLGGEYAEEPPEAASTAKEHSGSGVGGGLGCSRFLRNRKQIDVDYTCRL